MSQEIPMTAQAVHAFSFLKGNHDVVATNDGEPFNWDSAAMTVRQHLNSAMNAHHVGFLLGSGCSSLEIANKQLGIPTMGPLAENFVSNVGDNRDSHFLSKSEREALTDMLGLDIGNKHFANNLERFMEVLYSFNFSLERSSNPQLKEALITVRSAIEKVTKYILYECTQGAFSRGDERIYSLYEAFYRKLVYRDRALPRPWIFTTNYDLFNEVAMDRLGIPYSNGFTGTIERRFNPASFRYALAAQLDILSRKWTAVDNFVYLCKLHGSINWIEHDQGLFQIREVQNVPSFQEKRILIYPTPSKHSVSFSSPYSDLFREFQSRIACEQSVLFVVGYSFGDEHVNNILFQALTIPTFRLIIFAPPSGNGVVAQLRALDDPRIWIIGGNGPEPGRNAHYFDTIVEKFMPEPPGDKVDTAIARVLHDLVGRIPTTHEEGKNGEL